jgi:hypothetical protein
MRACATSTRTATEAIAVVLPPAGSAAIDVGEL